MELPKKFDQIEGAIGNTPLLEIRYKYKKMDRRIFAKAEYYNYTGSIKDRVALYILKKAYVSGEIQPGATIVEATSGNTGISFSALGRYLGHKVTIYMPDWMTKERISIMESFGARVRLVSKEEGGFLGAISMTEKIGERPDVYLPRQFSNEDNVACHYYTTGEEISRQLFRLRLVADGFVAGVGTGGTVMGIGQRLKHQNRECMVFPLEPQNSPTLSTGYKTGQHRIYGISDEFIPSIVKLDQLDDIVSIDDGDAIIMAQMLSRIFGLGVGVSSGANFLGAVAAQNITGGRSVMTTVFADDNKKYLSTDYVKEQKIESHHMSKDIELVDMIGYR